MVWKRFPTTAFCPPHASWTEDTKRGVDSPEWNPDINQHSPMSLADYISSRPSNFLRLALHGYSVVYLLLALACLVRWHTPDPWSRLDLFSAGYLLLRTLGSAHSLVTSRRAFRNRQVMQEWWATSSDPGGIQRVMILMLADLAVFLDYAHWHLVPSLERPTLQAFGLGLYVGVVAWQVWTDRHLANFFAGGPQTQTPMSNGPYRYVRHPRYAATMVGKVAFALVFGSVLGWLVALLWTVLLLKKVETEESHLRGLFGTKYDDYARKTARLIPGFY